MAQPDEDSESTKKNDIWVPYNGSNMCFAYPAAGPNDYQAVMDELKGKGLQRSSSGRLISLIDKTLQDDDDPLCSYVSHLFKKFYFWTATEHIPVPGEGIIVYDNLSDSTLGLLELTEMAAARNDSVRFVKNGFKTGQLSIADFLSNPLVIAHFGEDAMAAVERVASHLGYVAYVSAPKPEDVGTRYCALLIDKDNGNFALHGAGAGTGKAGYTFGTRG